MQRPIKFYMNKLPCQRSFMKVCLSKWEMWRSQNPSSEWVLSHSITPQKKYKFFIFPIYLHFPPPNDHNSCFGFLHLFSQPPCRWLLWLIQPTASPRSYYFQRQGMNNGDHSSQSVDQRQEPFLHLSLWVIRPLVPLGEKSNWKPKEMPWEEIWLYLPTKRQSKTHNHSNLL